MVGISGTEWQTYKCMMEMKDRPGKQWRCTEGQRSIRGWLGYLRHPGHELYTVASQGHKDARDVGDGLDTLDVEDNLHS